MAVFLFIFILTNIVFSWLTYLFLSGLDCDDTISNVELGLYALGIGPILTTVILYWSFLFFPHQSNWAYFIIVIGCFAVLPATRSVLTKLNARTIHIKKVKESSKKAGIILGAFIFAIAIIILADVTGVLKTPITGHDALVYGIVGKMLFADKSLQPLMTNDYSLQGFFYKVKNPPSFSLLLTWEQIVGAMYSYSADFYYRSISIYYALLIIGVQFYWLLRANFYLAIFGILALMSGIGFLLTLITHHLDSYRIFFLGVSWIFLAYSIQRKNMFSVILFGIFSGFAAFVHSIGMIVACVNLIALFIFIDDKFKNRFRKSAIAGCLILIFGGVHYIFDIIWGRGWVINKILRLF